MAVVSCNCTGQESTAIQTLNIMNFTTNNQSDTSSATINKNATAWAWIALYVLTICASIIGNILFIASCACMHKPCKSWHILLMNLAVCDILTAILCMPITLVTDSVNTSWTLGLYACMIYRWEPRYMS